MSTTASLLAYNSDQEKKFESNEIRELFKFAGVKESKTALYHLMENGMVERFNQIILTRLKRNKGDWIALVAPLVHAYNATKHDSTGCTLFFFIFSRHPHLAIDAVLGIYNTPEFAESSSEQYASKLRKKLPSVCPKKCLSRSTEKCGAQ